MTSSTKFKFSRARRISAGILLALTSVCITTLLLELAVRLLLPPPYSVDTGQFFTCHPTYGWIGTPHFHGVIESEQYQEELTFNSLGMHDTEHALEKSPHTFRILVLGDSFTHALQVDETQTTHQVLEDLLNNQGQGEENFEVISGGVVNWGTNQQLVYYREQGRYYNPDLVVLMFFIGNDLADNLPGNALTIKGFNCYAPYLALCDNELNPTPLTYAPGFSRLQNNCSLLRRTLIQGMGALYQHSRLYQQIEPLLVAHWPREQFGQNYPLFYTALYLPHEEFELEQAYQITQATLVQLQQEVEADGARFAIALISPWPVVQLAVLSPAEWEIFLRDNPTLAEAQVDRPNHRLAEFFDRHDIAYLDLTTPMVDYSAANARVPLYFIGEGHWTVEGNRVAAETLFQWLMKNNFLETESANNQN
ncbi:MAG: SGNH/GDSL hydrolase family protein [Anaerolineae bacterium]|nr:SGNH/GDSL hydrolase family protein [Anaerolineae bacterium]